MNFLKLTEPHLLSFNKNWGWFLLWGILLLILGLVAISAATITTLVSVVLIGSVILIAGIVIMVDAFSFWWHKWGGFFLHLFIGILYVVVGGWIITKPVLGSISLTLLLGFFYLLLGLFRVTYATSVQAPGWGWGVLNGLISLLIGVLILISWPASSLFILGLFIGIDLVFSGLVYIIGSLYARKTHINVSPGL